MTERRTNFIVAALNLDVLPVMKHREVFAKAVFDAAALITVGYTAYDLFTQDPGLINSIKSTIIATAGDLFINFDARPSWLARLKPPTEN